MNYSPFELDEFDRFIEAADAIRASQTCATGISSQAVPKPAPLTDMVLVTTGEVLRRVDTKILGGLVTVSLRLKRQSASMHEYIILAPITFGMWQYYPFELDQFHRFVAAAKRIRAAALPTISELVPA